MPSARAPSRPPERLYSPAQVWLRPRVLRPGLGCLVLCLAWAFAGSSPLPEPPPSLWRRSIQLAMPSGPGLGPSPWPSLG